MANFTTELLPLSNPVAIFLVVLVIILLAPVLLNRLKIPHIVGMIVAGWLWGLTDCTSSTATAHSRFSGRWDFST